MIEVFRAENLSFGYSKNKIVLKNINFTIYENDFVGFIGPNGGGKTTLLKLILGLEKPLSGQIKIFGKSEISRNQIGYLPQYSMLDDKFPISVERVVEMGLITNKSFFPFTSKKDREKIYSALDKVKLLKEAKTLFGNLSGGQKQRCLIARAIVSDPKILILDEPTASVDSYVESDIYEMLKELNKHMTIILVSHDLGFISSYVNKVFCINRELAVHDTQDVISEKLLAKTYGVNTNMISHHCKL